MQELDGHPSLADLASSAHAPGECLDSGSLDAGDQLRRETARMRIN